MPTAYCDCFAGISGDMFIGALVDAGLPIDVLKENIGRLNLTGFDLEIAKTSRNSIGCHRFKVICHDQPHGRNYRDIKYLIKESSLSPAVKEKAGSIFQVLARAEAHVHQCQVDDVHFHEVGAIDSIIDIIGAAIGLDHLQIDRLYCSSLPLSQGFVNSSHGQLPLPAPAVCELCKDIPCHGDDLNQELVTPTGAAIIKALADNFGPLPRMIIRQTGYGAGSRTLNDGRPNLLRIIIGEEENREAQEIEVMETNIDDMSPEILAHCCEKLMDTGALDVSLTPIQMKKGRPGFRLTVLADPADSKDLKKIILSETTAIGLRFRLEQRLTLPRQQGMITTSLGPIRAKKIIGPDRTEIRPEYEDCKEMARARGISLAEVYQAVTRADACNFTPGEERDG